MGGLRALAVRLGGRRRREPCLQSGQAEGRAAAGGNGRGCLWSAPFAWRAHTSAAKRAKRIAAGGCCLCGSSAAASASVLLLHSEPQARPDCLHSFSLAPTVVTQGAAGRPPQRPPVLRSRSVLLRLSLSVFSLSLSFCAPALSLLRAIRLVLCARLAGCRFLLLLPRPWCSPCSRCFQRCRRR